MVGLSITNMLSAVSPMLLPVSLFRNTFTCTESTLYTERKVKVIQKGTAPNFGMVLIGTEHGKGGDLLFDI